ncbi:MAG: dihydrofolate reductase [bacterium]
MTAFDAELARPDLRGIIVAVSPEGVIGLDGRIPWHHSADLKRFKRLTLGTTIVMGRLTWESIGGKPLPGRRNVVIASRALAGVEAYPSIDDALAHLDGPIWFIGGARIYADALRHANLIDVTYVPDSVTDPRAVRFPAIDEAEWEAGPLEPHDDPALRVRRYRRRIPA